ncbi:hepatitis A virus cellular receptor 2 homolog [Suncus etruscus]|uniref:hepatitis A virus cellular receptor 2 homolog n=1 Tax=Suncus etruscus TaxID=109475 RepID=UPI00210F4285|nr:hepatitis A virus cellular receptor 2 homolog [Suncus etruscus]
MSSTPRQWHRDMRPGPLLTSGESCALLFPAAKPRGSLLPFAWVLLWMLQLVGSAMEREYKVELGRDAHLPCEYSPPEPPTPLVPVCWGRDACPLRDCQKLLLRTNGRSVQQKAHSRYQLKGQLCQGDVSLTIQSTWLNDSGTYCCRIQFPGLMNDKKVIVKLTVTPAEVVPAMTTSSHFTDTFPWVPSTKGPSPVAGTETLGQPRDKNGLVSSCELRGAKTNEPLDTSTTPRTAIYVGSSISAGLALLLILSVVIFKCYSHQKEKLQNSRLITLSEDPPTGLVNRMHSEENIYVIEENVYEMENPEEHSSSVTPGH